MTDSQHQFIPAGCQTWHKQVIAASSTNFLYCSTLGLYHYTFNSRNEFILENIRCPSEKPITAVSICSLAPKFYAVGNADCTVSKWQWEESKEMASIDLEQEPESVEYCPQDENIIAILCKDGTVMLWEITARQCVTIFNPSELNKVPTKICWTPLIPETKQILQLAIGCNDGTVYFSDHEKKSLTKLNIEEVERISSPIIDLQWDPYSAQHVLVLHEDGSMYMVDASTFQVISLFHPQTRPPQSITFLSQSPGEFITTNQLTSTATKWNVARQEPTGTFKIGDNATGVHSIAVVPPKSNSTCDPVSANLSNNRIICSFKNGVLCMYNITSNLEEYSTMPNHSETIFDCRFHPFKSSSLVSASHDGYVKFWNTEKMEFNGEVNLADSENTQISAYSVSWKASNEEEDRLAVACSTGEVIIVNSTKTSIINRIALHSQPVYHIDWNKRDASQLLSVSADGLAMIFQADGKIIRKYPHPSAVYGAEWNPFTPTTFATGSLDGIVRIFDNVSQSIRPDKELKGHTSRVFNVAWSPFFANYLASGSDDKTVRVWNLSNGKCVILAGHKSNVRALAWHTSIPYVILTGAWDGSVRIWDIRTGDCLAVRENHHHDVYALASHPSRPFLFVSAGRDTTLRIWSTEELLSLRMMVQSVLEGKLSKAALLTEGPSLSTSGVDGRLCGESAQRLLASTIESEDYVGNYRSIFSYFYGKSGLENLWLLVRSLLEEKKSNEEGTQIVLTNDLREVYGKKLSAIRNGVSTNTTNILTNQQRQSLLQAASIAIRLGDIPTYCEVQLQLGEWERALAIAPTLSYDFWQLLMKRYASYCSSKDNQVVPDVKEVVALCVGDASTVINTHLESGKYDAALLVSVGNAVGSLPPKLEIDPQNVQPPAMTFEERDEVPSTESLTTVIKAISSRLLQNTKPIAAASAALSTGDIAEAVRILTNRNELFLAFTLSQLFQPENAEYVYKACATYCEQHDLKEEAQQFLEFLK